MPNLITLYIIGVLLVGLMFVDMWKEFVRDRNKSLCVLFAISCSVFWPIHIAAIVVVHTIEFIYNKRQK